MDIDFAPFGFRVARWRTARCWERPVSNGRTLTVTGAVSDVAELQDGELDVFLSDELYGSDRVYESWPRQRMEQVIGILVHTENNVQPLRLTTVRGVPFVCRLLVAGDRYGCDGRHTVEATDRPQLAFYDARYRSAAYGQYVGSLYGLDEFLSHDGPVRLNEGDREWTLDSATVALTQDWARLETARARFEQGCRPLAEVRRALQLPDVATLAIRDVGRAIGAAAPPSDDAGRTATVTPDSLAAQATRKRKTDLSM